MRAFQFICLLWCFTGVALSVRGDAEQTLPKRSQKIIFIDNHGEDIANEFVRIHDNESSFGRRYKTDEKGAIVLTKFPASGKMFAEFRCDDIQEQVPIMDAGDTSFKSKVVVVERLPLQGIINIKFLGTSPPLKAKQAIIRLEIVSDRFAGRQINFEVDQNTKQAKIYGLSTQWNYFVDSVDYFSPHAVYLSTKLSEFSVKDLKSNITTHVKSKKLSREIPVKIIVHSKGKAIPNAYISLFFQGIGGHKKTSDLGIASFDLVPGEYQLRIGAKGFEYLQEKIKINPATKEMKIELLKPIKSPQYRNSR